MKKIITLCSIFVLLFGTLCPNVANAAVATAPQKEVTYLDNGDYIETLIIDNLSLPSGISTLSTSKTVTKTKTVRYKNQSGDILWSVSIKATFSYNGTTSKCTSCSHSTTCPAQTWKIKSVSSSKSGNSATAKAVATHFVGNLSSDIHSSVTISCSKNGTIS